VAVLDLLNERFGVADQLDFEKGPGGLVVARIENEHALVRVALHGAHVLSFQPHGGDEVLWLSRRSYFAQGRAIRGGIPICWPWFGPHPENATLPSHGFARTSVWQVSGSNTSPNGTTSLELKLTPDFNIRALWPRDFELTVKFAIGKDLSVDLTTKNTGNEPLAISAALHSYIVVGDIRETKVRGLETAKYINTVAGSEGERPASGAPIEFTGETDRVYLDTEATCEIDDLRHGRKIRIAKRGSRSTVVWNPWTDKARSLPDLGEDQFPDFVCVETANARDDARTLAPGELHALGTTISVVN
jgi:glucose-6-phosphate 1-epimerase